LWLLNKSNIKNGEAEVKGNVGDIFDMYSIGWDKDWLVFPTIYKFDIGNGSEAKEFTVTVKKGTRIYGQVLDENSKPLDWSKRYHINGWEINSNVMHPNSPDKRPNRAFRISSSDETSYEIFLPSGQFTFRTELSYQLKQKTPENEQLFDEQTITIKDEPEIRLDLKLHKATFY
jgi:hypothetical protein